jgi:hypothetical protein
MLLVQAVAHLAAVADTVDDAVGELQACVVCCFDAGDGSAVLSQPSRVVNYERVTLSTASSLNFRTHVVAVSYNGQCTFPRRSY